MNTIARLWKVQQSEVKGWDRLSIPHKGIIRQAFIAGCEAMRDEMNGAAIDIALNMDKEQLPLRLVGGSDDE